MSKRSNGMKLEEVNKEWEGDQFTTERELLLFRLARIETWKGPQGFMGSSNCKICGRSTPYGSREYGGIEWPVDIQHYIEFHGHKPTEFEVQAISISFEIMKSQHASDIREALFKKSFAEKIK